jgi:hypothetical protein
LGKSGLTFAQKQRVAGSPRYGEQRDSLFLGGVLAHLAGMSSEISVYRPPILTLILQVFGTLSAVVAAVALGVIVFGLITGNSAAGAPVALPVLVSSLVSALILFGVAQVINYLGRTAHAAKQASAARAAILGEDGLHAPPKAITARRCPAPRKWPDPWSMYP